MICKLVKFKRFINRGFLIGPYCPIYGFGSVLITALLSRFSDKPVAVFFMAMVICGVMEYITSYVMEKLFRARWWDYSQKPFNLNGRICLGTLIPFGLMGLALMYGITPFFFEKFTHLSDMASNVLCVCIVGVMLSDTIVSSVVLGKIRKSADLTGGDDTENITRSVREALAGKNVLMRRAIRAFPNAQLHSRRSLQRLKEAAQARKEKRMKDRSDR